ncbi:MAG: nucleotidyltransferase domain-containing protein [Bacteroidales bacterium]|nr:nucleotidyltransferase domain-containing protein [Bacteroidales bacterium]
MLSPEMIKAIQDYFKTQPVLKAWVFGSYARNEETEDSDVDILVVFDRKNHSVGLLEHVRMMNSLESLLQRRIDLVEDGTLLPFATDSANHDRKLLYERAN